MPVPAHNLDLLSQIETMLQQAIQQFRSILAKLDETLRAPLLPSGRLAVPHYLHPRLRTMPSEPLVA